MNRYKKLPKANNAVWDWIASIYNKAVMKRLVIKQAWNIHQTTGREVHVCELFGYFTIIDSREKADINRSGKVGQMQTYDLYKASIWNSTAHKELIRKKNIKEI